MIRDIIRGAGEAVETQDRCAQARSNENGSDGKVLTVLRLARIDIRRNRHCLA
jgi:hypothetical protein